MAAQQEHGNDGEYINLLNFVVSFSYGMSSIHDLILAIWQFPYHYKQGYCIEYKKKGLYIRLALPTPLI